MATSNDIAEYLLGQIGSAGEVAARKMFGEFGLYCDTKVVAFICDNQLFIKPTAAGRAFIGEVEESPPYPGAKNWFLIAEDNWDDAPWLSELVMITASELPLPKPKKSKVGKKP